MLSGESERGKLLLLPNPMYRYGQWWSYWRETGGQNHNVRPTRILEMEGKRISSGFCKYGDGDLRSLVVESPGGEKVVVGKHMKQGKEPMNLIEFPPFDEPPLRLTHLSGNDTGHSCSVIFHYE